MLIEGEGEELLAISKDFATLISVASRRNFASYRVSYKINVLRAISQESNIVRISVYDEPLSSEIPIFLSKDTTFQETDNFGKIGSVKNEPLICSILLHASRCKDLMLFNNMSPLVSISSDFTKKISNEDVGTFTATAGASELSTTGGFTRTARILTTQNIKSVKDNNQEVPVNNYSVRQNENIKNFSIKGASQSLILSKNIEPFSFVDNSKTRVNSGEAFNGVSNIRIKSNIQPEENSLRENVAGSTNNAGFSSEISGDDELVPVIATVQLDDIDVKEIVRIPLERTLEAGKLFFRFDLLNKKGKILQSIVRSVNHSSNLDRFLTPVLAPVIKVKQINRTKNLITLKQVDQVANKIKLYKKNIPTSGVKSFEKEYDFIAEFNIKKEDEETIFKDTNDNSITTIYRAIPFFDERSGPCFGSQMISPNTRLQNANKQNFTSINTEIVENGIFIEIGNIPENAISVRLLRKDLTLKEKNFSFLIKEHEKQVVASEEISFLDEQVKPSHAYEYKVKFIYSDGSEALSSSSGFQEFEPLAENVVNLRIIPPKIINAGKLNVSFNVASIFEDSVEDTIKKQLKENDLDGLYESELKNERESFTGIVTHRIERHNLTTGEKEDLGTTLSENFDDEEISKKVGAKPLSKDNAYKYVISTQLRETETLLKNFTKTKKDEKTGKEFSFKPFKFKNPISLNKGTLATEDSLKFNHAKSQFSLGNIGNKKTILIPKSNELPVIMNASVKNEGRKNIINWNISGERNKIDHFLVSIKILNQTDFVARVHNVSDSNSFEFVDNLTNGEVGRVLYLITPIYNDYSKGKTFRTNGVVI